MKRNIIIGVSVALVLAIIGIVVFNQSSSDSQSSAPAEQETANLETQDSSANTAEEQSADNASTPSETTTPAPTASAPALAAGTYRNYSVQNVASSSYNQTIVFFFAPWCPECRAFKQAIQNGNIPNGTQVLEADFDSSTDLKKKYGVTLQSTFVRVNSNGDLAKKWVGYGKNKSLQTILDNVK